LDHLIVANLNIISIRYKFDQLKLIVNDDIDILIVQETKLDGTFPNGEFSMDGFLPPFRIDRNAQGGEILLFIQDKIPAKILKNHQLPEDIEGIFIELNMTNNKWLLFGTYHPLANVLHIISMR
jgi:exonuclease III